MITSKQRIEATTPLTLIRRKEIIKECLRELDVLNPIHLTEIERDALVNRLRGMGYHPPMFDYAYQVLVEEEKRVEV